MKAIIEIEVTGDFEEPLSNDGIVGILHEVIVDGAKEVNLDATYRIIKMIKGETGNE